MNFKRLLITLAVTALAVFTVDASTAAKKFTLVIDAGHGGNDPGAIGTYSKEKNINLNVALEFGRLVENNCPDVKVIYTRKTDKAVNLQERADIANRAKADLFISIHTNALRKGRIAYGAETYTLGMARSDENLDVAKRENSAILVEENYSERYAKFNPNSSESYIIFEFMQDEYMKQSVSLAKSIQKYYVKVAGRKNKGVHQAGFLVLRETSMPSVLTELGFISTPAEEAYLNSDKGIRQLARSIYEGFLDYKETQDGKRRATPPYRHVDDDDEPESAKESSNNGRDVEKQNKAKEPAVQGGNISSTQQGAKPAKVNVQNGVKITEDGIILIGDAAREATTPELPVTTTNKSAETVVHKVDTSRSAAETSVNQADNLSVLKSFAANSAEKRTKVNVSESGAAKEKNTTEGDANVAGQGSGEIDLPVFKIQFLTTDGPLRKNDSRLKEAEGLESYTEGGITKYTCLPTVDYNKAKQNLKNVRQKYPDAFIVAFKGEKRIDTAEAIREFRNNSK